MSDTNELRAVKLTKAQRRELSAMAGRDRRSHYADEYQPTKVLYELGLIDRQGGRYGQPSFAITDAGRALLSTSDARAPSVEEGKHG